MKKKSVPSLFLFNFVILFVLDVERHLINEKEAH